MSSKGVGKRTVQEGVFALYQQLVIAHGSLQKSGLYSICNGDIGTT